MECFYDDFVHLWHKIVLNIDLALRIMFIDVLLEPGETQLISVFKVSIVRCMLLYCVVRQMHESVINVLEINSKLSR